jgi:hypothetical protein
MTNEQLMQIAREVQDKLISNAGSVVDDAMQRLGIDEDISDDEWQSLIDMIFA